MVQEVWVDGQAVWGVAEDSHHLWEGVVAARRSWVAWCAPCDNACNWVKGMGRRKGHPRVPAKGHPRVPATGHPKVPAKGYERVPRKWHERVPRKWHARVPAKGFEKGPGKGLLWAPRGMQPPQSQHRRKQARVLPCCRVLWLGVA